MKKLRQWIAGFLVLAVLMVTVLGNVDLVSAETVFVDRKADIVFVIDVTGSMGDDIGKVKSELSKFITSIDGDGVDVRVKFVTFGDITIGEKTSVLGWYSTVDTALEGMNSIKLVNGGDLAETAYDGLGTLFTEDFGFRSDAYRFAVLLTDANSKVQNNYGYTCDAEIIQKLRDYAINTSVITDLGNYEKDYKDFVSADGGVLADIKTDFSIVLKGIADEIMETVGELDVHEIYPTEGLVKTAQTVNVRALGVNYSPSEFKVTVGGVAATDIMQTATGFSFKVPTTHPVGTYDIKVVNGKDAIEKTIGTYTYVNSESEIGYKVLKIEPATSEYGNEVTVKVTVDKIVYAEGFKVTLGGTDVKVTSKDAASFSFEVPGTYKPGTYEIVVTNGSEKKIGNFVVTGTMVVPTPGDYNVLAISCLTSQEGETPRIKVTVDSITEYLPTFSVTVGGKTAEIVSTKRTYFYFVLPSGLSPGSYDIIVNNGTEKNIGTYEVTAKPLPGDYNVTGINCLTSEEGQTPRIKVSVDSITEYLPTFSVTVGGKPAGIVSKKRTYFYFTLPSGLGAGSYDIIVNNGTEKKIGTYEVTAKPLPGDYTVTGINCLTSKEGVTPRIKVSVDSITEYLPTFSVTVGGKPAGIVSTKRTYFYFTLPSGLGAGSYDIIVNNGTSKVIGTYTVTK